MVPAWSGDLETFEALGCPCGGVQNISRLIIFIDSMGRSILAAKMGARLTIATDKAEMLPLLRHNARLNNVAAAFSNVPMHDPVPAQRNEGGQLVGMPLPWGCADSLLEVRAELQKAQTGGGVEDGLDDEGSTYPDVVLGSDLVYGQPEHVLRNLLSTLGNALPLLPIL